METAVRTSTVDVGPQHPAAHGVVRSQPDPSGFDGVKAGSALAAREAELERIPVMFDQPPTLSLSFPRKRESSNPRRREVLDRRFRGDDTPEIGQSDSI
jgi:hypothetical protein